jgi:DNA polymerase (family X)
MARPNEEVEALLQEYADLISITGGDAFKARAYEKAARAIGGHHADVSRLDVKGLQQIPNVGKSVAEKIVEYFRVGKVPAIEEARAKIPAGVRELTAIPTLGPKKAMALFETLHISSIDELVDAIHAEKLRGLKGFGEKTEENILHGIALLRQAGDRVHVNVAMDLAEEIVAELSQATGCERCTYAGSLRRMKEAIGDVDILAAASRSGPLMDAFARLPYVADVIARGDTKTSIRTTKGLQVDLRVVPRPSGGMSGSLTGNSRGCACCTARSSTSAPTGASTGRRSSSTASISAWPPCTRTSTRASTT